jgi:hypothetical protein
VIARRRSSDEVSESEMELPRYICTVGSWKDCAGADGLVLEGDGLLTWIWNSKLYFILCEDENLTSIQVSTYARNVSASLSECSVTLSNAGDFSGIVDVNFILP